VKSNIPNLLTWVRLVLAPLAVIAILRGQGELAVGLVATAALTDGLDGALARRWGAASRLGAYLDPLADKALLSGVFLALAATGAAPWWLVAIIFGRDILLLAGTAVVYVTRGQRQFPPTVWGKLSTLLQILSVVAWLLHSVMKAPAVGIAAEVLIWPTALATVWSGVHYFWRGWKGADYLAARFAAKGDI
jgi:cardiolipin synthase